MSDQFRKAVEILKENPNHWWCQYSSEISLLCPFLLFVCILHFISSFFIGLIFALYTGQEDSSVSDEFDGDSIVQMWEVSSFLSQLEAGYPHLLYQCMHIFKPQLFLEFCWSWSTEWRSHSTNQTNIFSIHMSTNWFRLSKLYFSSLPLHSLVMIGSEPWQLTVLDALLSSFYVSILISFYA